MGKLAGRGPTEAGRTRVASVDGALAARNGCTQSRGEIPEKVSEEEVRPEARGGPGAERARGELRSRQGGRRAYR